MFFIRKKKNKEKIIDKNIDFKSFIKQPVVRQSVVKQSIVRQRKFNLNIKKLNFDTGIKFTNLTRPAPVRMQQAWKNMSQQQRNILKKFLPDSDRDGVPNGFDCQPFNPRKQDDNNLDNIKKRFYGLSQKDFEKELNNLINNLDKELINKYEEDKKKQIYDLYKYNLEGSVYKDFGSDAIFRSNSEKEEYNCYIKIDVKAISEHEITDVWNSKVKDKFIFLSDSVPCSNNDDMIIQEFINKLKNKVKKYNGEIYLEKVNKDNILYKVKGYIYKKAINEEKAKNFFNSLSDKGLSYRTGEDDVSNMSQYETAFIVSKRAEKIKDEIENDVINDKENCKKKVEQAYEKELDGFMESVLDKYYNDIFNKINDFFRGSNNLIYLGTYYNINGKDKIDAYLEINRNTGIGEIKTPKKFAGLIIGKGGENLRKLSRLCNLRKINVVVVDDWKTDIRKTSTFFSDRFKYYIQNDVKDIYIELIKKELIDKIINDYKIFIEEFCKNNQNKYCKYNINYEYLCDIYKIYDKYREEMVLEDYIIPKLNYFLDKRVVV